jgi:steroid Delta-isomerase
VELVRRHIERFNEGVRTGDYGPMLEQFTDDAELAFEGVPAGPFYGRDAIAAAYAEQPPDDQVDILGLEEKGDEVVVPYSWHADEGRQSGRMIFTVRDDKVARLLVTFEQAP